MSERHGIEIDYCPQCRGVWLDRGELDKILKRAEAEFEAATAAAPAAPRPAAPAAQPLPGRGYDPRVDDRRDRGYNDRDDRGYGDRRGYDDRRDRGYDDRGYGDRRYDSRGYQKKRNKLEWLGDLFEN